MVWILGLIREYSPGKIFFFFFFTIAFLRWGAGFRVSFSFWKFANSTVAMEASFLPSIWSKFSFHQGTDKRTFSCHPLSLFFWILCGRFIPFAAWKISLPASLSFARRGFPFSFFSQFTYRPAFLVSSVWREGVRSFGRPWIFFL